MDPRYYWQTLFSCGGLRRFLFTILFPILLPLATVAAETNAWRHVHFREPREGHYIFSGETNQPGAVRGAGQLWTQARREGSGHTVEIGSRVVLQVDDPAKLNGLLANRSLTISR